MSITTAKGNPLECYLTWQTTAPLGEALLLVEFDFSPWWVSGSGDASQPLTALYFSGPSGLRVSVTDLSVGLLMESIDSESSERPLAASRSVGEHYWAIVENYGLLSAVPGEPLRLLPTHIAKPWGQEIWFTGVEERGVCFFGDGEASVPIPWLQAVMPDSAAGPAAQPLILLKILDPAPEDVTGDLYFELHEEKREVYVVTHVDSDAWGGGKGGIRFGFDPQRVAAVGEEQFRADYLAAVRRYEEVRREIDSLPDLSTASAGLQNRELQLRDEMNAFTHIRPLSPGDVVVVPLLVPHSLQHGVRTIEFQTPVYERQILSFAQQVLTQNHWDTESAVAKMRLTPPPSEPFEQLFEAAGVTVERIVDFQDFEVRRVYIAANAYFSLELGEMYGLVMVIDGQLKVGGAHYSPEQAAFFPSKWCGYLQSGSPEQPLVLLLAIPVV